MTGKQFRAWIDAMKDAGLAKSAAECGRLLGRTPDWAIRAKDKGTDTAVALACRALLHRLEPWGDR